MPGRPKREAAGRRWGRMVKMVVQKDFGRCIVCGHYGAKSADHVIPVTEAPERQWDTTNLKACHAWPHGCTDCTYAARQRDPDAKPVYCNGIKSGMSMERARRIIEERTGLKLPEGTPGQSAPEGRIW